MKISRLSALLVLLVLLLGACASLDSGSEGDTDADGPIRVAFIGDLSGVLAPYGTASLEAVRIAIDEANEAGGIDGREIELDVYDDKADPTQTVNIAKRVAAEVAAVITASGSSGVLAAGPVLERARVPFIVTVSSNPAVTESGWEWVSRVHLSDADQVRRIVGYAIEEHGITRLGIIHDTTDFGQGGADLVTSALAEFDMELAAKESFNPGRSDFATLIGALKEAELGGLVFWGLVDPAARFAEQMGEFGLDDVQLLGGGGIVSDEFIELAGKAAEGTIASWAYVDPDSPVLQEMTEKYEAAAGRPPDVFAAQSYDAANILIDALAEAGTESEALQAAIRAAESEGAAGEISFDENGQAVRHVYLAIVKDGRWTLLEK